MSVGLDDLQGLGECFASVEAESGAGVPMPFYVKAIVAFPIEAHERAVKFLAERAFAQAADSKAP
jgi:hypothetical protein